MKAQLKTNSQNLKRKVMRRVYYSYLLQVFFSRQMVHGVVTGFSGALFVHLVSVHNIILNLLAVQLGAVPSYIWQVIREAAISGEFVTLLSLGVLVFSLLSFRLPRWSSQSKVQLAQT